MTLSEQRSSVIEQLGEQITKLNNGEQVYPVVRYVLDLMIAADKMVRGPEDCIWRTTAKGLRSYAENWLNNVNSTDRFRWALTQYTVYLAHALDAPATVPKPARTLDPNSETYRCM